STWNTICRQVPPSVSTAYRYSRGTVRTPSMVLNATGKTIIVAVWYTLVFPVAFNTMLGVRTVPRLYRYAVLTLGGTWRQIVFQVLLPGAIPYIVGGVRLGIAYG